MTPETTQQTQTLQLHRHIRAPPERVYKAFLDADALVKWMAPHGFTAHVDKLDARVGGEYHMKFTNFGTGSSHSFGGKYLELTPFTRIRHTDSFDDPTMPGTMEVTIEFKPSLSGTFVTITQAGIPAAIPLEFATMGWQESLLLLAQLVEPDIPDGSPEA